MCHPMRNHDVTAIVSLTPGTQELAYQRLESAPDLKPTGG